MMAKDSRLIVDASIAIKWVVPEDGTIEALRLLEGLPLSAPDLLISECANILWKKIIKGELSKDEASVAARLLQNSPLEILPSRSLMERATLMAIELEHPTYDCLYLSMALEREWPFVTADQRLLNKPTHENTSIETDLFFNLTQACETLLPQT